MRIWNVLAFGIMVCIAFALTAAPTFGQAEADVGTIKSLLLGGCKEVIETGGISKFAKSFADNISFEIRKDYGTREKAKGKENVIEAIANEPPPPGKLATTGKDIKVVILENVAVAITDFKFTNDIGDTDAFAIFFKLKRSGGKWVVTEIAVGDNQES